MGDDAVGGATAAANKFLSKHRWGRNKAAKLFSQEDDQSYTERQKEKERAKAKTKEAQNQDVDDFLKPSTQKAQQHRDAAAAAFLAGANKPKIDVAKAQRYPEAHDIHSAGFGQSPLPIGGIKKGRKKGYSVSFARTQPEIIGHGGEECEDLVTEVSERKKSNSLSESERSAPLQHLDDLALGTRSPKYHNGLPTPTDEQNPSGSINKEALRRGIVHRTNTSAGELSPELKQKMEMGRINTQIMPREHEPAQRLGSMGLSGERPRPLQRAPTGFDLVDDGVSRPSLDSTFTQETDISPHPSIKPSNLDTVAEDDFVPKPLSRTATGWSEHAGHSDDDEPPRLPEFTNTDSPIDLEKPFSETDPIDPKSFSARLIHKMRAEEGRALHAATTQRGSDEDDDMSVRAFQPPAAVSPQRSPQRSVGHSPPSSSYVVPSASVYGRTPPRPLAERPFEPQAIDPSDPLRSRARQYSPARKPMAPGGQLALDTNARPPSSSSGSLRRVPSGPRPVRSPVDPYSAVSNKSQPTPTSMYSQTTGSVVSHSSSIQPTPPTYERPGYFPPSTLPDGKARPPPVPPHAATREPHPPQTPLTPGMRPKVESSAPASAHLARANTDARAQGEVAYADFAERVVHMQGIFRLTAELGGQLYSHSPVTWLRVAIWWFLRGRVGMEAMIRGRPKGESPGHERLTQPHVDIAKTWWIISEIFPNHPSLRKFGDGSMVNQAPLAREAGDLVMAEVYDVHDAILSYMKLLLGSMKRHHAMPPTQALIQGQDQSIWISYPSIGPDVQAVLSGGPGKLMIADKFGPQMNPAHIIPLGDTKDDFCYFRMFVTVTVAIDNTWNEPMPAVLSVMRPRDEVAVKLALCSQNDMMNILIQSDPQVGPTWKDVKWKVQTKNRGMEIHLRRGYIVDVEFAEQDFRSLWAIVDHTNRTEAHQRAKQDERVVGKYLLRDFSYKDPSNPQAFPPERVKGCRVTIFEKNERSDEGTGKRRLHRGFRVMVITNTKNRTLSCVNHEVGKTEPLQFQFMDDRDLDLPAMSVQFKKDPRIPDKQPTICTAYFVFNDRGERNHVYGTLTSANVEPEETVFADVALNSVHIESADPAEGFSHSGHDVLKRLKWQRVKAMNQDPEKVGLESAATLMSENLRIVARHGAGSFTDRLNLNPGDLLVRLPTTGKPELCMLRNPQKDMAFAIDSTNSEPDIPDALAEMLRLVATTSTLRTFSFNSLKDLHDFQVAVTGFLVLFDGIASTFSISRRRMVVPIYKHWTATTIRLQVVQQDSIIQLLAFFEDFSHADAMNFQLKSMDVFEKLDKNGKFYVKLVDAKFALPVEERRGEGKMGKEEGRVSGWAKAGGRRRFVCLDLVEYPGEHDDILIGFEDAAVRDRFLESLPAQEMQRKMTLRRKI